MNTIGLSTGTAVGTGVFGEVLRRQLPADGAGHVAGQAVLALTGISVVLLLALAATLLVVGVGLRMLGRAHA